MNPYGSLDPQQAANKPILQISIPAGSRMASPSLHGFSNPASVKNRFFPTRLKSKKVEIGKEKMSQMIVKEKLSERAVMKEKKEGLDECFLKREEGHQ